MMRNAQGKVSVVHHKKYTNRILRSIQGSESSQSKPSSALTVEGHIIAAESHIMEHATTDDL